MKPTLTIQEAVVYETASSWLLLWLPFKDFAARMILRRAEKKLRRYVEFCERSATSEGANNP
jgi:hypothetical protein